MKNPYNIIKEGVATTQDMLKKYRLKKKALQMAGDAKNAVSKFTTGVAKLAPYQKPNLANEASLYEKAKHTKLDKGEEWNMTNEEYNKLQKAGKEREKMGAQHNPALMSASGEMEYMGNTQREKEAFIRRRKMLKK